MSWFFIEFILGLILTKIYIFFSFKFNIVDDENKIGNHIRKTPRGVGIICTILPILFFIGRYGLNSGLNTFLLLVFLVTSLFFIEDLVGIDFKFRFILQAIFAIVLVYLLREDIDQSISISILEDKKNIKYFLTWFGLLWFFNLYNFMDGIDMITGVNTIFFILAGIISVGYFFSNILSPEDVRLIIFLKFFAVSILAFLFFNKPIASVFLGDSGSIGFGFIVAFFLVKFAKYIGIGNAYAICSYYILDATISLFIRIYNKEKIYLPNSSAFFFQKAKKAGLSVYRIIFLILTSNLISFLIIIINLKYFSNAVFAIFLSSLSSLFLILYFNRIYREISIR